MVRLTIYRLSTSHTNHTQNRHHTFTKTIMKKTLLILLIIINYPTFGQNKYRIEKCVWNITKPADYITRIDNFEEIIKLGEEYVEEKEELELANDSKTLFSIAKSDSSPINMMIASYQGNENIKNYTLKGYAKALGAYFKESSKEDDPKNITTVKVSEVVIDKIKFYLISSTLTFTEKKYAYTSDYYVTEIQGKEFSIAVMYDNEIDKRKIEKSITESTFK